MNFNYNSELDILTVEEDNYSSYSDSAEFANFVIDFSENGELLGVEIIDASEVIPIAKEELENITDISCSTERTEEYLKISLTIEVDGNTSVVSSNFPVDSGLKA